MGPCPEGCDSPGAHNGAGFEDCRGPTQQQHHQQYNVESDMDTAVMHRMKSLLQAYSCTVGFPCDKVGLPSPLLSLSSFIHLYPPYLQPFTFQTPWPLNQKKSRNVLLCCCALE